MDVHKPKPFHNLREFGIEIATIVIGVVIALGAEQVVEEFRWHERVAGAEEAMRAELRQNDRDAYFTLAVWPCKTARLDEIQAALTASKERDAPVPTMTRFRIVLRPWSSDAWESAKALQIVGHIPSDQLQRYAFAYVFPAKQGLTMQQEVAARSGLNTLGVNSGRLQPAERDRLFEALVLTRDIEDNMANGSMYMLSSTGPLGIALSAKERDAELAAARESWGPCVAAPRLRDVAADRAPIK